MADPLLDLHAKADRAFDEQGYVGPIALQRQDTVKVVAEFMAGLRQERINRHRDVPGILDIFNDKALLRQISRYSETPFTLWRTNFFAKGVNAASMGEIGWHHDKHFQNEESDVDFDETGAHLSVLVALQDMTLENGAFELLPGTHRHVAGLKRDPRPMHRRTRDEHFVALPAEIEARRVQITLRQGEFLLFHSALLHRSLPYASGNTRISLTGRLVRNDIVIPDHIAAQNYCVELALPGGGLDDRRKA